MKSMTSEEAKVSENMASHSALPRGHRPALCLCDKKLGPFEMKIETQCHRYGWQSAFSQSPLCGLGATKI